MKTQNLLRLVITLFVWGSIITAFAKDGEFSISGNSNNSILGEVAIDGQNYLAGMTGDLSGDSIVTVHFFSTGGQFSSKFRVGKHNHAFSIVQL